MKGQESISNIFVFSLTIVLSIMLFILMSSSENMFEGETDIQVKFEAEQVKTRSLMTSILEDKLWRVADHGSNSFEPGKYDNDKALKLISVYFSSQGDKIYFGTREVSRSDLKTTLEDYLVYKLDTYLVNNTGNPADYRFTLEQGGEEISVQSLNGNKEGQWFRTTTDIALTGGENVEAVLWIRSDTSIYDLTGESIT